MNHNPKRGLAAEEDLGFLILNRIHQTLRLSSQSGQRSRSFIVEQHFYSICIK